MRYYDVAIASLAVKATSKWTDNLITQHTIPDVISARRGTPRRITHVALVRIALIRQLHSELGVSVADAVRIATQMIDSDPAGVFTCGQLTLAVDLEALERQLAERLASALESAPSPRRGRPPGRART